MSDSHSFQANLARKNGRRGEGVQGEPFTKQGVKIRFRRTLHEKMAENGKEYKVNLVRKDGRKWEGVQGEPCAKKWPKMERSTRRTLYEKRHGY